MGLPIFREPSDPATKTATASHKTTDPTAHARSSIRRQSSIHPAWHRSRPRRMRSPPPHASDAPVPPFPRSLLPRSDYLPESLQPPEMGPLLRVAHSPRPFTDSPSPLDPGAGARPPRHHYRRHVLEDVSLLSPDTSQSIADALDHLPPLRRMGDRSIHDQASQSHSHSHSHSYSSSTASFRSILDPANDMDAPPPRPRLDGLGDRDRSPSPMPDTDHWETLLTTIAPDPSVPSASTSFASTAPHTFPDLAPTRAPRRAAPIWARTPAADPDACDDPADRSSPFTAHELNAALLQLLSRIAHRAAPAAALAQLAAPLHQLAHTYARYRAAVDDAAASRARGRAALALHLADHLRGILARMTDVVEARAPGGERDGGAAP